VIRRIGETHVAQLNPSTEWRKLMAKTIAKLVGAVFIVVGIVGFFDPHLLHANLGKAHNVVHLVSGALSLYFGFKGSMSAARQFCLIFGIVYGLLGVCGYFIGTGSEHMLVLTPYLQLGMRDHIIHIVIAALYLIGGLATKSSAND
jgi:uncharacterized membrane protein HdeD (DUF308 family)